MGRLLRVPFLNGESAMEPLDFKGAELIYSQKRACQVCEESHKKPTYIPVCQGRHNLSKEDVKGDIKRYRL